MVIDQQFGWEDLEQAMHEKGFKKVREFVFRGKVTEQTYQIDKMKIDFFGQFYRDDYMIQYSYERIESQNYADENQLSVYLVTLPRVNRTKLISVDGVAVPVPDNAEDILKCIYNEDWRIPNPNWKSNSGKCSKLLPNESGYQSIK